jgi:hypothetical protein
LESQCSGEVVSASGRNDEHWQRKLDQCGKVSMDRPVATEEHNHIGFTRGRGKSQNPGDIRRFLERF